VSGSALCLVALDLSCNLVSSVSKHVVFGRLINGMEVLREVEKVSTDRSDVPLRKVTISDCGELPNAAAPSPSQLSVETTSASNVAVGPSVSHPIITMDTAEDSDEPAPIVSAAVAADPAMQERLRQLSELRMKLVFCSSVISHAF